jgi:hypothetical protein
VNSRTFIAGDATSASGDAPSLARAMFAGGPLARASRNRLQSRCARGSPLGPSATSVATITSAPSQDVYAITGGTGAYVGAAGTMRRSGNGKTDTDVFELR